MKIYYTLAQLLVNKYNSLTGRTSLTSDSYLSLQKQFRNIADYNKRVRVSQFINEGKTIEVHTNETHGGLECKFVNQKTEVEIDTIRSSIPEGVTESDFSEGFNPLFGNSELSAHELDDLPWDSSEHHDAAEAMASVASVIEKIKTAAELAQLEDIVTSVSTLFN